MGGSVIRRPLFKMAAEGYVFGLRACTMAKVAVTGTAMVLTGTVRVPPGFMHYIAANGYVFSFFVGMIVYILLMKREEGQFGYGFVSQAEYDAMIVE